MKSRAKGYAAERELIHMLQNSSISAIRVAGSGVSRFPCPDILAGNGSKIFAIECKSCKDKRVYISDKQVRELV